MTFGRSSESAGSEADDFCREVERFFVSRSGGALFLNPVEWDLVRRWEREGVPLAVVRAGIVAALERAARDGVGSAGRSGGRGVGLRACARAVASEFRAHRRRQAAAADDDGGNLRNADPSPGDVPSEGGPDAGLRQLAAALRQRAGEEAPSVGPAFSDGQRGRILEAALAVEEVCGTGSEVERELEEIETALARDLAPALRDSDRERIQREAEAALSKHRARMPPETAREALDRAIRQRTREALGLPRLTLFG